MRLIAIVSTQAVIHTLVDHKLLSIQIVSNTSNCFLLIYGFKRICVRLKTHQKTLKRLILNKISIEKTIVTSNKSSSRILIGCAKRSTFVQLLVNFGPIGPSVVTDRNNCLKESRGCIFAVILSTTTNCQMFSFTSI